MQEAKDRCEAVRTTQKLKLASEDKSLWTAKDSMKIRSKSRELRSEEFKTEPPRVLAPFLHSCVSCCYMKALQATDSERQV